MNLVGGIVELRMQVSRSYEGTQLGLRWICVCMYVYCSREDTQWPVVKSYQQEQLMNEGQLVAMED